MASGILYTPTRDVAWRGLAGAAPAIADLKEAKVQEPAVAPRLKVEPLDASVSLRTLAYDAMKRVITAMDIYDHAGDIRLDERQLS